LSRDNAKRSKKDLNLANARKFKTNEKNDSDAAPIPFPLNSNFMKLALHEVQKSTRGEGSSTGRKSNRSGKDTLRSEERNKLRDLRSIFYKQTNLGNTESEKTSARNKSGSKMISKDSTTSLKHARRSSHKKSIRSIKKDVSPMKEDSRQTTFVDEISQKKMLNVTNPFTKSKSLLRGSKSRKKRSDKVFLDGIKKVKVDKIKFKSPKAHSLGKKKLSKIKMNSRVNKFIGGLSKKSNHNTSNMNSARSKGNVASGSKESKKSIKVVKKNFILKPGEGKLRFSQKVNDAVVARPTLMTKHPLKVLKKISPEKCRPAEKKSGFNIALDRVSQYNNF
jgi:hypothetical protein